MKNKGFTLLITIILLAAMIFLAVLDESNYVVTLRSSNDEREFKVKSVELARSCRNEALLSLALDPNFRAHEQNLIVGSSTCSIDSINVVSQSASGTNLVIFSSATVQALSTHVQTNILLNDNAIILQSSFEIPDFK